MRFVYLEFEVQQWLMHFQVKMVDEGRKNMFRDNQVTNKGPPMFLYLKLLTER